MTMTSGGQSMLDKYHYIVVEGPIGAGKTSLATRLADRFRTRLLLENADANPFLPNFYKDPTRYALPTQLFFLFQRADQIKDLSQRELFATPTVADFLLAKDALFARLNLDDHEFALYQQIYQHIQPSSSTPDLVIYLQAPAEVLLERVRKRNTAYERGISAEYLERLAASYSEFFYSYSASPLLIVNSENLNFVEDDAHFDILIERIAAMRGGREFFNRAGDA